VSNNTQAAWTIEVIKNNDSSYPSPTEDFILKFTLTEDNTTYIGSGHFAVGDNMAGNCGASGVCNWGLKTSSSPVLINQTIVE
jgi:hypothetical protein